MLGLKGARGSCMRNGIVLVCQRLCLVQCALFDVIDGT
jgi:hypothetical protein